MPFENIPVQPKKHNLNETYDLTNKYGNLIGNSKVMQDLFSKIEKIKNIDINILILGESGTGKGMCAHEIHNQSTVSNRPFITIECSSIPENLLESELFGYEKGAFTGAHQSKPGKLELADGGTIFLDEIGELNLGMQVKLLRFLQEKKMTRVGGTLEKKLDVRIITATNKNLLSEIENKDFRLDLYYRISEFVLEMPTLCDRGEDIITIAEEKLKEFSLQLGKSHVKKYSNKAKTWLRRQSLQGNIRELEAIVRKALIYTDKNEIGEIQLKNSAQNGSAKSLNTHMNDDILIRRMSKMRREEVEAIHIRSVLKSFANNKSEAARWLKVSRQTLFDKVKKYNIV